MTAIIILNYNSSADTIKCIDSIQLYNTAEVKFIVVDNGSSETGAIQQIEDYLVATHKSFITLKDEDPCPKDLPYFTFISSDTNDGYAQGNNKGLRFAYSDISVNRVLILNNDTLFIQDIIPKLISLESSLRCPAFITPLLRTSEGEIDYNCARSLPSDWDIMIPFLTFKRDLFKILTKIRIKNKILLNNPELIHRPFIPVFMPSGSCMLINKETMRQLGGFDNNTFLYYEENILGKKVESAGMYNYCIPSAELVHHGAGSTKKISNTFLQRCNLESADYYLNRFCDLHGIKKAIWNICKLSWKLKWALYK